MRRHRIEVHLTPGGVGSSVKVDGMEVQVRSITISAGIGQTTDVTLVLNAVEVVSSIEGVAENTTLDSDTIHYMDLPTRFKVT